MSGNSETCSLLSENKELHNFGRFARECKITYGSNGPLISGAEETNQQLF